MMESKKKEDGTETDEYCSEHNGLDHELQDANLPRLSLS
jgi:hypothetical protein